MVHLLETGVQFSLVLQGFQVQSDCGSCGDGVGLSLEGGCSRGGSFSGCLGLLASLEGGCFCGLRVPLNSSLSPAEILRFPSRLARGVLDGAKRRS